MVKPYSKKIAIAKTCTAISNLSRTWEECWGSLLKGEVIFAPGDSIGNKWPKTAPLSMIADRAGWKEQPPFMLRFRKLANMVAGDMKKLVDELATGNNGMRIHVIVATCHSDPCAITTLLDYTYGVTDTMPDLAWKMLLENNMSEYITESLERDLPVSVVSSACASALVATSSGADMINADLCDAVLIVALDSMARVASAGFHNIGAMTKTQCAPYDVNRTGTTVGEGAVGFMLVDEKFLPADQVYAHVSGTSIYCDAAHIVEPNPEGVRCVLEEAIEQAGLTSNDINGIYWHGTGTKHNDRTESLVSELMFGEKSPPCTSTKGSLGHTMGASGAYNILAACATNETGLISPVASLIESEYPNLDVVQGAPREVQPGPVLVTALGFGGINAAVVVTP